MIDGVFLRLSSSLANRIAVPQGDSPSLSGQFHYWTAARLSTVHTLYRD